MMKISIIVDDDYSDHLNCQPSSKKEQTHWQKMTKASDFRILTNNLSDVVCSPREPRRKKTKTLLSTWRSRQGSSLSESNCLKKSYFHGWEMM